MGNELRKNRSLVRKLEQRVDPRPRVAGEVDMILTCIKAPVAEADVNRQVSRSRVVPQHCSMRNDVKDSVHFIHLLTREQLVDTGPRKEVI